MQLTAREIARLVEGQLTGNPDELVTGVAAVDEAQPGEATFIGHPKYLAAAKTTRASVVIVGKDAEVECDRTLVRVDNPSQAFGKLIAQIAPPPVRYQPGIHPTACVAPTARCGKEVSIQPHAVVEDGAIIGDRTVIGAGSFVGPGCQVGANCLVYPNVSLRERTVIGDRVIVHCGVVLGADGFGYEMVQGQHKKIPQVGSVEIGNDVEIGANSTIDRGRFGKTRIGNGTKIDNLVQIGHNCILGEHCIVCALVGIAGSTKIGSYVTIAGQVGIAGHLTIGDKAIIMAQAGVTKDVSAGGIVLGSPAVPHKEFKRVNAAIHRLPDLATKLRALEQEIAALRAG